MYLKLPNVQLKVQERGEQDGGGLGGQGVYISLHGYMRNTPSDTEAHAGHQLRADRSPTLGPLSESEEKHLRLRVKQLIWQAKWNENQTVLAQPCIRWAGMRVFRKGQRLGAGV